jgi:hypothetical protein
MAQVTWRASTDLVDRVRDEAARQGRSLNDYLTRLAEAATDPDLADSDQQRLRERLAQAGLLAPPPGQRRRRPDPAAVARARRRAGRGTPVSDLVSEDRG